MNPRPHRPGRGTRANSAASDADPWRTAVSRTGKRPVAPTRLVEPTAAKRNLTWCVARQMVDRPPADGVSVGRVVNVGSRGACLGDPDIPAYGASQAGLHSLGQSLARHLGPHGIAVTSIAPGLHRHRDGRVSDGRPRDRRGDEGAEPVPRRRDPGGGGRGRRHPRRARGRAGLGLGPRLQRCESPALGRGDGSGHHSRRTSGACSSLSPSVPPVSTKPWRA